MKTCGPTTSRGTMKGEGKPLRGGGRGGAFLVGVAREKPPPIETTNLSRKDWSFRPFRYLQEAERIMELSKKCGR